jgi:hypothetical protein
MVLIPGQTRVIDVLTAVITAQREFIMTTSDPKTATLQAAPADSASEPKATTKAHTAPRKPRVAPAKGKAEKKTTQAKKGAQKTEGREAGQGWRRPPRGQQSSEGLGPAEKAGHCHTQ